MVRKIRNRLQKRKREEAEESNENVKRLKSEDITESKAPTIEINTDANTTVVEHTLTVNTQPTIEIEAMEEIQPVIEIAPPQEVDTVENEHNVSATEVFTPEGATEILFSENESSNQNTLWRMFGYVKDLVFG
jgi:hypothetical protein